MLRALLAHTEEHGYVRDPQGRFLLASDVLARSLGYDDPDALLGEPVPERVRVEEESAVLDEHGELVGFLGIAGDRATHAHRLHEIIATQRDVATADLDVEAMMGLLCERTMELTDADGATVALLSDGELRIGATRGSPDHPAGEVLSLDASLGGLAIRDRRSLITHDALDDARVNPERVRATGVRSIVAVPCCTAASRSAPCSCCPEHRTPSTTRT